MKNIIILVVFLNVGIVMMFAAAVKNQVLDIAAAVSIMLFAISYYVVNKRHNSDRYRFLPIIFIVIFFLISVYKTYFI